MNITLSFVCLGDEQICNMPTNAILVTHGVSAEDFLQTARCQPRDS